LGKISLSDKPFPVQPDSPLGVGRRTLVAEVKDRAFLIGRRLGAAPKQRVSRERQEVQM
jgi:hypothetical protein